MHIDKKKLIEIKAEKDERKDVVAPRTIQEGSQNIALAKLKLPKLVETNHPSRVIESKISYDELLKAAKQRNNVEYLSPFEVLKRRLWGVS